MGLFDLFKSNKPTEVKPKPEFDPAFDSKVRKYIETRYGVPYVTQEELRRKEYASREALRRIEQDKREKEGHKEETEGEYKFPTSGVRYSVPTSGDMFSLSNDADDMWRAIASGNRESFRTKRFRDALLWYINRTGMSNAEIYKKANLSKSVFSAIISNQDRIPKKNTIIALAIALKLDLENTERLLMKAGYTFSNSIVSDLVVVYCINHGIYDIDKINVELDNLGEPILGSKSY